MKQWISIIALALLATTAGTSARAEGMAVGAGFGFNYGGVLAIYGDYDISKYTKLDKIPVKARVGLDHYSRDYYGYSWSYNIVYGGAYADLQNIMQLDPKFHPIAGLGLGVGSASCSGRYCNGVSTPSVGGLYYIVGAQYDFDKNLTAEASLRGWGGLTLGVNYRF